MGISVNGKFDLGCLYSRRFVFVSSLLIVFLLFFSFFVSVFSGVSVFASGASASGDWVHKVVSDRSELDAAVKGAVKPTIIEFSRDITLKDWLYIPEGKNITLTNVAGTKTCKLIGGIGVGGVLTLDGIIITNKGNDKDRGISIGPMGTLILVDGEISGKDISNMYFSRGAAIYNEGAFLMYGGRISNNAADEGCVYNFGTFNMLGGVISNNRAINGGGVYNKGVFSMSGGMITNNVAVDCGGGVYNEVGTFSMSGGTISNNTANAGGGVYKRAGSFNLAGGAISNNNALEFGGGVYNNVRAFSVSGGTISGNTAMFGGGGVVHNEGTCTMSDGVISGNTATSGGGVYIAEKGFFFLNGGVVSNNRALGNGGGIWITDMCSGFNKLFVAKGVVFSNNYASTAYNRNNVHKTVYDMQIKGEVWSEPFTQGYNNYDISYIYGTPLAFYNVTIQGSYASHTGTGNYTAGSLVTIEAGVREGYTFSGWTVNKGRITLTNSATTTFTMPANEVIVTAKWTATQSTWVIRVIVLCTIAIVIAVASLLLQKKSKNSKTTNNI